MPELPEVEIVKRSLEKTIKFKKIKQVFIKNFIKYTLDETFFILKILLHK